MEENNAVLLTDNQETSQDVTDSKEKDLKNLIINEVFKIVPFKSYFSILIDFVREI